ncbi:cation diffusion facilitator family transporter [Feifania hominis]|uniref:Cation transporter n=1 Tax=Feifania hominis TaxID=2763660 RepID=A0A926DE71_9FIRM|nr:cation diffusion facilitator family transporter [Feifania hominis]MBC8535395.1 cation transporter [Feifania hominis]
MTNFLIRTFIRDSDKTDDPKVRSAYGRLTGIVGILCNLLLCAAKLIVGAVFGSVAITADGINNLSDAGSSVVTLVGFKLASKPADKQHPYGHARIEYLAGLVVSFFILLIGFDLCKSAFGKIVSPDEVTFSLLSVAVLAVSILVKLWMGMFYRRAGRAIHSSAIEAAGADSMNDVYSTAAVLVCTLVARFTGLRLDGWVGLGVAVFILYSGIKLIGETLSPLLGEAPDPDLVQRIYRRIRAYDGVLGIHDLMVHDYGPGRRFASVHVEMDRNRDVMESHDITDRIEREFAQEGINLVVHLDPIVTDDEQITDLRRMTVRAVSTLGEHFSIHDFRVVKGVYHTNLIFDVVVPTDCSLRDQELLARIDAAVKQEDPNCYTVVTIDRCYTGLS